MSSKPKKSALNSALDLLARREHFSEELKLKLLQKGYPENEIAKAISYLEDKNYLNNLRALELYAEEVKRKNKGFNYLKQKLIEKGLSQFLKSVTLRNYYSLEEERKNGEEEFEKMEEYENEKKIRKLINQGFSFESIRHLIKNNN